MSESDRSQPSSSSSFARRARWGFLLLEAVLIVVSILLAFAIDAWWEGRQEEARRVDLIGALREDFATTSAMLDEAVKEAADMAARTGQYMIVVEDELEVSRDSMIALVDGLGEIVIFEPTLPSYRTALSDGSLRLARNPDLHEALTEFELALTEYNHLFNVAGDLYFLGPLYELRSAAGGFHGPTPGFLEELRQLAAGDPETSPSEFRSYIDDGSDLRSDVVRAVVEPKYVLDVNMVRRLFDMDRAAERIVRELDAMLR
jgi:hypothetical protein